MNIAGSKCFYFKTKMAVLIYSIYEFPYNPINTYYLIVKFLKFLPIRWVKKKVQFYFTFPYWWGRTLRVFHACWLTVFPLLWIYPFKKLSCLFFSYCFVVLKNNLFFYFILLLMSDTNQCCKFPLSNLSMARARATETQLVIASLNPSTVY